MNSTLRFRKARNSADELGQIFTPPAIASLLADAVASDCEVIVDVGAGEGALASAVLHRCPSATVVLIEKDRRYAEALSALFSHDARVVAEDALTPGLLERIIAPIERPVILSNPPYGMLRVSREQSSNLEGTLPPVFEGGRWVRRDAAFLSRIWSSSNKGATLGLIVASAIVRGKAYELYRRKLVEELAGLVVTELHLNTFANTEVQAYLISGCRSVRRKRNVLLRKADLQGNIVGELFVPHRLAIERFDYTYHSMIQQVQLRPGQSMGSLSELGGTIARGSRSQNEFKGLGLSAFHTTDFVENSKNLKLSGAVEGFNSAYLGDILIPRVGSRCLIREAKVVEGRGLITDCIYRIRAPQSVQKKVWSTLDSDFGREWRRLVAKGSCAKYITISALSSLPILA
ncbi:rRNA adenine N-6-methyltransferase family protein [Pseudomonas aeruginosa]|uniref:rRNA adenine N-6-methyltransferase family protein n=1 Tax=Pseudomonas aeruginosa TaxID=287 RepID=UPI00235885B9|nr:rRNA adenine N-6-methyltransferase family protein [Pseudomonas aeruginosa]MDY1450489.1 rRNA adenine N-6-methyltransferase family protein [Pseudomonas aeruginosa]HEJ2935015.1 methyltransferase [Pseudomonas aeruginosa]